MKAKFVKENGTRVSLRVYWGDNCNGNSCHNAMKHLFDTDELLNGKDEEGNITYNRYGGDAEDHPSENFPQKCDNCGLAVPETAKKQVSNERKYDTDSGKLEPGCLYYAPWYDDVYWDNQNTPSLCAILPNGATWCIDGRASNCTMKDDRTHRCWVRHGSPEEGNVHVDKNGHTCAAGGGSIDVPGWHGFLHNGQFNKC